MEQDRCTEKTYWEERWDRVQLPAMTDPATKHPVVREVLRVFGEHLPQKKLSALEIGGAPGRWIAYLNKYYGYDASVLEYTEIGCEKTRENFRLLGREVTIYHRDFFDDLSDLPSFDVVLSMGFIEHFKDLDDVFKRHAALLKEGGILILGVPNFSGIAAGVLRHTAPEMLSRHNLEAMNLERWNLLEKTCGLTALYKGYLGGFQPKYLTRRERKSLTTACIKHFFKGVHSLWSLFPFLTKYNSPKWSAYLLGIYEYPYHQSLPADRGIGSKDSPGISSELSNL